MSRTTIVKSERKNATTQTNDTDTMLEIARLQEQVKLLKIEVDYLRKYTNANPLNVLTSVTPSVSPTNVDESAKHSETKRNSLQNQSCQSKNKITPRGCGCKGKCSSKLCGCVRKNTQCGDLCRCNTKGTCQNQENKDIDNNKENLNHNELIHEHLENQSIINKHLADAKQRKIQNGLFSPNVTVPELCINLEQFDTAPLYFGSPKKLTFGSDEEQNNGDERKNIRNRSKAIEDDETKIRRLRRGRNKKNNLEVNNSKYVRKLRSTSNEEKHMQNRETTEKKVLRRCSSTKISVNQDELKQMVTRKHNNVQNVKHGMVFLRRNRHPQRRNESFDTEECENEFDPMKPKHELPRTPISSDKDETISSNVSNISLPTPVITTQEEQSEIPAELSQPEVNWEEYQSLLVACHKCKRKFHPFRIKKHVSCCKKI